MPGFRFLVRTDATFGHALSAAGTAFGPMALRLSPLFPYSSKAGSFGLSGGQDWFLAETSAELDPATAWDECYERFVSGQALAAAGGITYAEPDWPQAWIPPDRAEVVSPFGVVDSCVEEEGWMNDGNVPHGTKPDWHLDDMYSGLRMARNSVSSIDGRRVRVGHLDTGYDPAHQLLPEHIRHDL